MKALPTKALPTKALLTVAAALLVAGSSFAGGPDVHVDAVNGDDVTGDGTPAAPYRTVTKGIAAVGSTSSATIHVAPGIYGVDLGEVFPLSMSPFMTLQGAGAHHTFIVGEGSGILVEMEARTLVSDVTIMRGDTGVRSEVFDLNDFRYLRRCVLRDNQVGANCEDNIHSDSGFALVNCSVVGNQTGILHESHENDFQSTTLLLYGTTVTGNDLDGIRFDGWGERYLGVFDSIVRGNQIDSLVSYAGGIFPGITGNVLGDPTYVGVDGNVDVDPQVVDLAGRDHHLTGTSPVIDNPAPDVVWPPQAMWVSPSYWIWEATFEEIDDLDGDRREIGAEIDPGCDEYDLPGIYTWGAPKLGAAIELKGQAGPFDALLVGFSLAVFDAPVLGYVWLKPPITVLGTLSMGADGVASLAATLPSNPSLAGLDVYLQGALDLGGGFDGTLPVWARLLP